MPEDAELEARIAAALNRYRSTRDQHNGPRQARVVPGPNTNSLRPVEFVLGAFLCWYLLRAGLAVFPALLVGAVLTIGVMRLLFGKFLDSDDAAKTAQAIRAAPDRVELQVDGQWQPHDWNEVQAISVGHQWWELTLGPTLVCFARGRDGLAIAEAAQEVLRERQRVARELAGVPDGALSPAERLTETDADRGLSRADA